MTDPHAPLRDRLLPLPGVISRRMFGSEAFFVGPAMFAFFTPTALVVRLSPTVFNEAVTSGRGRPFLSFGASHLNGWAEVPLSGTDGAWLERLALAAHATGLHAARSAARRKRPARARRVVKRAV